MKGEKLRVFIQSLWTLITNGYLIGFVTGKIYTGKLKNLCVPGMNCYSCPGALGSCPIGSLQAVITGRDKKFSFYVIGFLFLVGAFIGRFVCGYLCPFGLVQDLLNKIKFPLKINKFKGDKLLRKLKYVILMLFVFILPMYLVDFTGLGSPYFCKYICPVGSLEAGIPLIALNEGLRGAVGGLYIYKNALLVFTIILSIIVYRPFCKYICPLGAIYSLFNSVSVLGLKVEPSKCISCKKCNKVCLMGVDPTKKANDMECIRCLKCKNTCPTKAISFGNQYKNIKLDDEVIENET